MNYRRLNPNFAFKALTVCYYFKIISNEAEFIIKKISWLDFFLKEIKENIWSIQIQEAIPKNSLKKYQWPPDVFQKSRWIHKLINYWGKVQPHEISHHYLQLQTDQGRSYYLYRLELHDFSNCLDYGSISEMHTMLYSQKISTKRCLENGLRVASDWKFNLHYHVMCVCLSWLTSFLGRVICSKEWISVPKFAPKKHLISSSSKMT